MIFSFYHPRVKIDVPTVNDALTHYIKYYYDNIERDIIFRSENTLYRAPKNKNDINKFINMMNIGQPINWIWRIAASIPHAVQSMKTMVFDAKNVVSEFRKRFLDKPNFLSEAFYNIKRESFKREYEEILNKINSEEKKDELIKNVRTLGEILERHINFSTSNISSSITFDEAYNKILSNLTTMHHPLPLPQEQVSRAHDELRSQPSEKYYHMIVYITILFIVNRRVPPSEIRDTGPNDALTSLKGIIMGIDNNIIADNNVAPISIGIATSARALFAQEATASGVDGRRFTISDDAIRAIVNPYISHISTSHPKPNITLDLLNKAKSDIPKILEEINKFDSSNNINTMVLNPFYSPPQYIVRQPYHIPPFYRSFNEDNNKKKFSHKTFVSFFKFLTEDVKLK